MRTIPAIDLRAGDVILTGSNYEQRDQVTSTSKTENYVVIRLAHAEHLVARHTWQYTIDD